MKPLDYHILVFGVALLISAGLTVWGFRNRDKQAIDGFVAFTATTAMWNLAVLGKILAPVGLIWPVHLVEQFFTVYMTLSWFYFTMSYAGYKDILRRRSTLAIVAVAGVSMLLVQAVPPFADLGHGAATVINEPFQSVTYGDTAFAKGTQLIGLVLVGIGSVVLIHRLISAGYVSAWQTALVASVIVFTMLFEFLEEDIVMGGVPGIDYSAIVTASVGVVYAVALYRYDLFGHRPVAKSEAIKAIDDPVFVLAPSRVVVSINESAREFVSQDFTPGDPVDEVLPEVVADTEIVTDYKDGYEEVSMEIDDTTRYFDVHGGVIESMGNQKGLTITLRDITDIREREQALEKRTEHLKQQTEQLDQFASVVSHDLRNPLSVAQNYIELAEIQMDLGGESGDDMDNPIMVADEALDRMDRMIDDALTLARGGEVIDDPEPQRLIDIATEAWKMSDTRDASLNVEIQNGTFIEADDGRLKTLFENVFRNPVDHVGNDVSVTVGTISDGDRVTGFYVADDGPGIPEDQQEKVFEKGHTTAEEGTGFGLAIVESVAEAHGWDVQIVNDGGARFEFIAPDAITGSEPMESTASAAAES